MKHSLKAIGAVIAALTAATFGCNSSPEPAAQATTATPVANTSVKAGDSSAAPTADEMLRQIDDVLEWTFKNRRLSVGSSSNDQAAWQIIHGALAYKREFLVNDGA